MNMFHTFNAKISAKFLHFRRPSKVNKSCSACVRRKIKCDGGQPCKKCESRQVPEPCVYRQRARRRTASKGALQEAVETMSLQTAVLESLFPNTDYRDLANLPRCRLISLLSQNSSGEVAFGNRTGLSSDVHVDGQEDAPEPPSESESDTGEQEQHRNWDEPAQNPATIGASDDINAVNTAGGRHHRSYLGICSVNAALRALFRFRPSAKKYLIEQSEAWTAKQQQRVNQQSSPSPLPVIVTGSIDSWRDIRHINFYFEHIHGITPLLHEESFKAAFVSGNKRNPSWLGLCNMVLAMGSIAAGNESAHINYYNNARSYLDLESLGCGNLETLQTLCLLGGYYLQYRNSPNMAYAILGGSQRLALALGLHREIGDLGRDQLCPIQSEIRRRTWWSLYCLDTWASMTLGRPTCGRWDWKTMNTSLPSSIIHDDHFAISLGACVHFCHISNQLQHRFAQRSRMDAKEARRFDDELRQFYSSLPTTLTDTSSAPPRIAVAIAFLRNRYHNVRLMLSRCFLLYMAYETQNLSPAEAQMVELCHSIAKEIIDTIALNWTSNRIQVWNSNWYLFQACMVPLLSIAMARSLDPHCPFGSERILTWQSSLGKAQQVFKEMSPWMRPEDRFPDVVNALVHCVSEEPAGSMSEREPQFSAWSDEFAAEVDWSLFLNEENPFQTFSPLT